MTLLYIFFGTLLIFSAGMIAGYFGGYEIGVDEIRPRKTFIVVDDSDAMLVSEDYYFDLIDCDERLNVTLNLN